MAVERIVSSTILTHHVLQQSISIVLFVALWSYESFPISSSFSEIAQQLNCSSNVSLYEYDIPISEVHRRRPRDRFFSFPWLRRKESIPDHVAYNITSDLPWFPALRVFETEAGQILRRRTYQGSFAPSAMRKFLERYCRNLENENVPSPHSALPSELSQMLYIQSPTAAKGVLVFAQGDANYVRLVWEAAAEQLGGGNSANSGQCMEDAADEHYREWRVSVFDKVEYRALAERYNIALNASTSSIVLLDAYLNKVEVLHDSKISAISEAMTALKNFDEKGGDIWDESGNTTEERGKLERHIPIAVPEWLSECAKIGTLVPVACSYKPDACAQRNSTVLSSFSELKPNTTVWVVFFEPWCAYCQRVIPWFISFAEQAAKKGMDSRVYSMSKISSLPSEIDHLVDGFPTVLFFRGDDHQGRVKEYAGSYDVDSLLSYSRNSDS